MKDVDAFGFVGEAGFQNDVVAGNIDGREYLRPLRSCELEGSIKVQDLEMPLESGSFLIWV